MSESDRYFAAADKIHQAVERLKRVPHRTPRQTAALITDLETEVRNLRLASDALEREEAARPPVAAGDPIPDDAFVDGTDEPYLVGGSPGNPNGVTFTTNLAIAWFRHVWANGIGYHNVRPSLLPGSRALTASGLAYARSFQERDDLTEAPEDFNPLDLPVVP